MLRVINVMSLSLLMSIWLLPVAGAQNLSEGLVGYWPLDGDGTDKVGGSVGELVDGADWVNEGRLGGAVELDGVTGHVKVTGFTPLTTQTLTAVAWLKGWRQSAWAGIVVSRNDPTTFWLGFTDQDTLSYVWNNNNQATWGWRDGPKIPQDEWAMVAITIDPKQAVAYVYTDADGLQSATNAIAHVEQTVADNLKFGWDECCGTGRHVLGLIDEVMLYDRALSADEIRDLAVSGLAVDARGKLAVTWSEIKRR